MARWATAIFEYSMFEETVAYFCCGSIYKHDAPNGAKNPQCYPIILSTFISRDLVYALMHSKIIELV